MSGSLIFSKREELQRQIEEFNARMSCNCSMKECEFPISPEINKDNEVLLSEKLNVVLTLYTLYPAYRKALRKLIFLYLAVGLNIESGNYPNASACLKDLYEEWSKVKKRLKEIHHPPVFVNLMTQALLAHELCHYKFRLSPELWETEISDVKKEIVDMEFPGFFRGRIVKKTVKRLEDDSHQLEELACDKAAAMQLAKLLNSGAVEDRYVGNVIEQTIRLYSTLQLWENMKELQNFSHTLSNYRLHMANHAFFVIRVGFIAMYIVANLERDCEFSPDVLKREIMDYGKVLQDMTYIIRSNLKYGSVFSLSATSAGYDDEDEVAFREAVREDYKELGKRIMDYLEYIIHSD